MSDKDKPPETFGRDNRTIIRPNPGARRPVTPQAPAPPPAAPSVSYPVPPSAQPNQRAGMPASTLDASGRRSSESGDEWIATPTPAATPSSLAQAADLKFDELAAPNANPIMRAAGPLLHLLGRLRVALMRASFASLMEQVAQAVIFFEKDIRAAGVAEAQANVAKYVLCATADDIVQNIPTEDRHVWTQYSMLSRFFGERIGGVRFFDELERTLKDPLLNYPLLELQHACLALGFQGIHRTAGGGGQSTLQQIQRNVYEVLRRVRPRGNHELSPHWQGQDLRNRASRVRVPVWAVAATSGVLLFGLYIVLRTLLGYGSDASAEAAALLHPDDKIEIARRVPAPPPPPPPPPQASQRQRICAVLKPEIDAGRLICDQTATRVFIRVGDLVLFQSGQATVLDGFKPVALRLADALEKEQGEIKVTGHSDSVPLRSVRFASNWHLSVERAKAVAEIMKTRLTNDRRIVVDGKGADVPIATNATTEGRARNRRVEISIPRVE